MTEGVARVVDDTPPPPDDKARAEAVAMSSGKLKRDESWQVHLHRGGLLLFWFAIACLIMISGVWLFNLLAPLRWHFLDDNQRSQVQNLMIAALGSSVVTDYAKRLVNRA